MNSRQPAASWILVIVVMAVSLTAPATGGGGPGQSADQGRPQIMPVSEVRPGMTGYGLTSLRGVQPDRFQVEVLGVLKGAFPKGDIILVRMSGPVIDETGAIAGMSGSPVYVDGKLLGAVAYGWLFSKVPLAGLTPAQEMMRVADMKEGAVPEQRLASKAITRETLQAKSRDVARLLAGRGNAPQPDPQMRKAVLQIAVPPSLEVLSSDRAFDAFPAKAAAVLPKGAGPGIRPLPIPLAIGGSASGGSILLPLLEGAGFMPVQVASPSGGGAAKDAKLEPGVPVGAALITGDMDVSGIGTLTWVEGDRALAFGHPMFGSGETDIPLAIGEVQAVVPSMERSFKLAAAGKIVGRIVQDRESAVMAKIGEEAPTFTCEVHVRGTVNEDYSYRLAGYWEVAPMVALLAIADSSERWEGTSNRYTLRAKAEILLRGRKAPLVLENVYTSYGVVPPSFDLVAMPIELLLVNPYEEVQIDGLTYDLDVTPGFEAALIESAWADRAKAKPGSEVNLYVRLRQYRGEEAMKKLQLRIPDTVKPGSRVDILLCDAMTSRMIRRGMDPAFYAPRSLESLVNLVTEMESNKKLMMRASIVEQGVRYAGGAMPALPPSALSVLQYNEQAGRSAPLITDIVEGFETPWVLEGSQLVSVEIEKPEPYSP